jgi:hypothetical protein
VPVPPPAVPPPPGSPVYYFVARRWLSHEHGLEAVLTASRSDPAAGHVAYAVTATTAAEKHAGSDALILVELLGERGASGPQLLAAAADGGNYGAAATTLAAGESRRFGLRCADVGRLTAVRVWLEGSAMPWLLDHLAVVGPDGGTAYFVHRNWLQAGLPPVTLNAQAALQAAAVKYSMVIRTSDIRGAGTDANVYIELRGERGTSGRVPLDKAFRNDFEAGAADRFDLELPGLGALSELIVGMDASGAGAAWHLAQVDVTEAASGQARCTRAATHAAPAAQPRPHARCCAAASSRPPGSLHLNTSLHATPC